MSGNRSGAIKARDRILFKDPDFFKKIGAAGGAAGTGAKGSIKGFAANKELASIAGAIGGRKSRRGRRR